MRISALEVGSVKFNNFRSKNNVPEKVVNKSTPEDRNKRTNILLTTLAVTSLGLSAFAIARRGSNTAEVMRSTNEAINSSKEELKEVFSSRVDALAREVESKISTVSEKVNTQGRKISDNQRWNEGFLRSLDKKIDGVADKPVTINSSLVMDRNWVFVDGMRLRQNTDNGGVRKPLGAKVVQRLREVPMKFISGKDAMNQAVPIAVLGTTASVWLPSAETKPEKEGGLGEVPVQMASNYVKEYNLSEIYIPRPLIEIPGKSYIKQEDGVWKYWYDGLKDKNGEEKPIEVKKVVEFETMAYHNGVPTREKVEVFYGIDPAGGYKRLMFRNPNYFAADGLYAGSVSAEEPERYTFFSRALYDFIKLIKDPDSITYTRSKHPNLLKSIKAPDAMVLNDWHVAPVAALARALAPVEAGDKKLSQKVADYFENINLMYIVHNADYQGKDYSNKREDILNTLFGQYTYDIYRNAQTGFYRERLDENDQMHIEPIYELRSPFTVDKGVNMANMAMSYANIVKPVSQTYAKEMGEQAARSTDLLHISEERLKAGTMVGQSNGWDRSVNEVSTANLSGFNNMLNKDKFILFKNAIDNIKDLSEIDRKRIQDVFLSQDNKINVGNFELICDNLDALNIESLDLEIKKLKDAGVMNLRKFKRATSDMDEVGLFEARKYNKSLLLEHIKSMIEYDKTHDKKLFNIQDVDNIDLSYINFENIEEVPFYNMGVRFVDQKGVDILSGALIEILSHWDEWYPGKPMPVINVGGADPSADKVYKNMIKDAKAKLGDKGKTIVQWDGFVPNNILMAGSDWTLRPSHFEPDGDKWESLYKGTPMVMTRVGGHIDSIKDNYNGFLTSRTVPEIENYVKTLGLNDAEYKKRVLAEKVKDYVEAFRKSLDAFYDSEAQKKMVLNSISGNQSWVIKDKEGKIVSCPSLEHLRDLGFDLKAFPQISETAYNK